MAKNKNPFVQTQEHVGDIPRNVFDLSFQNNVTMQFGGLYPVFIKEGEPSDSFNIDPVMALNFMPMVFPVQTRMRAHLHFFKVRKRNLWSDYMDFYGKTKPNLVTPYIDFMDSVRLKAMASTGSLGDYLGLPTTLVGAYGAKQEISGQAWNNTMLQGYDSMPRSQVISTLQSQAGSNLLASMTGKYRIDDGANLWYVQNTKLVSPTTVGQAKFTFKVNGVRPDNGGQLAPYMFVCVYSAEGFIRTITPFTNDFVNSQFYANIEIGSMTDTVAIILDYNSIGSSWMSRSSSSISFISGCSAEIQMLETNVVTDIDMNTSPYYSSSSVNKAKQLMISALPFRAYESIYNGFYRNILNNPFLIDGVPEYNKYIPTNTGGADTNIYSLRYRNWESDFLTSCVQTPQQGENPPLVGITEINGQSALALMDSTGAKYSIGVQESEDGKSITGIDVNELTSDESKSNFRTVTSFIDVVSSGISISDFRNVNAYQRWLEVNVRKGLRFKDIVKGHFNVDIRYDELNMPEFIGGVSQDVYVNQISQTVEKEGDGSYTGALGAMAGQASCVQKSAHQIECYCDEPCYIIGILSVVPVPNYSQLLPKMFLKRDVLDSYYPEFGHISMQPVPYREVCPIQTWNENPDLLTATFGYQRAWYDYLASVDEVHGLFRTNMRNFLINRTFDVKPELSESFLLVDPNQVNDVFSVTETTDKIFGQVWFKCTVKRPIPRFGIPKLEA